MLLYIFDVERRALSESSTNAWAALSITSSMTREKIL